MKQFFAFGLFLLLVAGCDRNDNPVDQSAAAGEVEFSEATMYKTAVAAEAEYTEMQRNGVAHDSVRHGKMLGTMKWYVGLTEEQFDSIKVYGKTLFDALKDIRAQVCDSTISREEAKNLVQAARDQFIVSVQSILTEDQQVRFEEWIVKFWNRHHRNHRGGHHGRGGSHGSGGRP